MDEILVLKSPVEIVQYLDKKLAEDRYAHIEINSYNNKGIFTSFIKQAKIWYDPNVCGCKKKGLNEDVILTHYRSLQSLSKEEKNKVYRMIGREVEFRLGDEVILKIP